MCHQEFQTNQQIILDLDEFQSSCQSSVLYIIMTESHVNSYSMLSMHLHDLFDDKNRSSCISAY